MPDWIDAHRISQFRRGAFFLSSFAASKSLAIGGPIALAMWLPKPLYGAIEYSLSWASLLATVVCCGMPSVFLANGLGRKPEPMLDVLALHTALAAAGLLAGTYLLGLFSNNPGADLILLLTILYLAQSAAATVSRVLSWPNVTAWVDTLVFLVVVLIGLAMLALRQTTTVTFAALLYPIASGLLAAAVLIFLRTRQADLGPRLKSALKAGLPFVGNSLASNWIHSSPRVLIGSMLSVGALANYVVCFRVLGLAVVWHVLFNTALFARIYRQRATRFDRYVGLYIACLLVFILGLRMAGPYLLAMLAPSRGTGWLPEEAVILAPVSVQVLAWCVGAALEMRLTRLKLIGRATLFAVAIAGVTVCTAALALLAGKLTLVVAAWIFAGQTVLISLSQVALMRAHGLFFRRIAVAASLGYVTLALT